MGTPLARLWLWYPSQTCHVVQRLNIRCSLVMSAAMRALVAMAKCHTRGPTGQAVELLVGVVCA